MSRNYPAITFTDSVRAAQERNGSRGLGQHLESMALDDARLSITELSFIAERDGFYMATVNEDGWPYLQFRGGPKGFLRALDERTLGYADFRGNRQYISTGNLAANDRTALFFMDYPNRRRLKLMARAEVVETADRPELVERLTLADYPARVERAILFRVAAFDWNCPQHITPRFTLDELEGR
ncbi:pyridoxamine 5'-phosphate oxidase family protein [Engelhardtia mirabilis]|uniref:Pyridoxamine 5'-phosphate oxidase n=1 Tax=Engelhardtia mirabilis TaxID=2528011 RepID=A0A518BDT4_9BACT|nr:Pyridoxamine 5'-phosphate oxidase [Planctomycetes bacterium Pla133]QDU99474.1 Pyridoxamine 5'-phosphate oxidase [Planctomycetes bacterium Pla86]